jgi:hypothetical protein
MLDGYLDLVSIARSMLYSSGLEMLLGANPL